VAVVDRASVARSAPNGRKQPFSAAPWRGYPNGLPTQHVPRHHVPGTFAVLLANDVGAALRPQFSRVEPIVAGPLSNSFAADAYKVSDSRVTRAQSHIR